jgi:hypothetical protein
MVCGCRVSSDGDGTVLLGDADSLASAPCGPWRMALAFGHTPEEKRTALEARLGAPVLRITLAETSGVPELVECPDIAENLVEVPGRRPGTDGLAPPGSFVTVVDETGEPLPPGKRGHLRRHCHTGTGPTVVDLGTGGVDAEGFVSRIPPLQSASCFPVDA